MSVKADLRDVFKNIPEFSGKIITLQGWIRTNRGSNKFGFLEINDGTHFNNMQVVYDEKLSNYSEVSKFPIAAAIEVTGELILTPEAKQPCELKANKVILASDSELDYPLQKKRHSFEYLRTIAHIRPRSNTFSAVFRVRSVAAQAFHEFFADRGFVYVHTPIITASDCEGAGEMFQVTTLDIEKAVESGKPVDYNKDFFSKKAYLTVSGQLNVEPFALAFKNVYTFGPTFRAENSNTSRHMSEFWMIEPELAFADLGVNMTVAEDMVKFVTKKILETCSDEMEFFDKRIQAGLLERLNNLVNSEFRRMTYTEAIDIIKKSDFDFENEVNWGDDLKTEHERYIAEKIIKGPVFLTDYPKEIKAFYMRLNDDGKTMAACDLLVPGVGELIGGSQREERYDKLLHMIKEKGQNPEDYKWYLDTRKYGGVYHSGFGIGFERYIMYITGMENIRDVIPYPRTPRTCEF